MANKLLEERLAVHDYYKLPHTPELFTHKTRSIWFTLTVGDFGVKYICRKHAEHLMIVLKKHYKMEEDWEGELYCGIALKWNYEKGYVDMSMPTYLHKKLIEYTHKTPKRAQYCPYLPPPVRYGKEPNLIIQEEESPPATDEEKKYIEQGIRWLLLLCTRI